MFSIVQYTPVTYGLGYQYPTWAEALGICISLSSMLWIPLYAGYYIYTTPGTLREVISAFNFDLFISLIYVFLIIFACYTTIQILTKGVTPIFKTRSEFTSPVIQHALEDVHGSHPASSLKASSELDGMNHRESAVVMVSFNIDKVKI